jgi:fructose transport system ATP-binding protein
MFFGALIVGVFEMGLRLVGTDPQWTFFLIGVLIIFAVAVDQWIRKVAGMMEPILKARGPDQALWQGHRARQLRLRADPGEILAVIGDNGAGKSTLIKAISGAVIPTKARSGSTARRSASRPRSRPARGDRDGLPDPGHVAGAVDRRQHVHGARVAQAGHHGLGLPQLDRPAMEKFAREKLNELGLMTIQNINQAVETLSGGQRQGVAVARAAAFGSKVVILDEPTAALGVKESRRVLELIRDVRARGIPIILISHNMPHVFEVADRIHIHRLGKRLCVIKPEGLFHVGRGGLHDRRQGARRRGKSFRVS